MTAPESKPTPKPRIVLGDKFYWGLGTYICSCEDFTGFGKTPQEAFAQWKSRQYPSRTKAERVAVIRDRCVNAILVRGANLFLSRESAKEAASGKAGA